jgi:hypothetical protein
MRAPVTPCRRQAADVPLGAVVVRRYRRVVQEGEQLVSPIEVVLGDGMRVAVAPGFDPQTLRRVIDALKGTPC